jgi:hypothetical protein
MIDQLVAERGALDRLKGGSEENVDIIRHVDN